MGEGLTPSQIEKMMIEEILDAPKDKKDKKDEPFDFTKTVTPILEQFKKQMLEEKEKMQKQLHEDIATIKACAAKMKKSMKLSLLETGKKKKPKARKVVKKCPTKDDVKKCVEKNKKFEAETESMR